ncbi:hypothetical protein ACFFX0_29380 [Citricoccus parietis]|uniref:Uncharacterized protein n=1 Tax=Citricoccus parietis TaxID=592307 RepID=A0ABV5G5Z8_9MICC
MTPRLPDRSARPFVVRGKGGQRRSPSRSIQRTRGRQAASSVSLGYPRPGWKAPRRLGS